MLKNLLPLILLVNLSLTGLSTYAQQPAGTSRFPANWSQDYPPFRIAGNLFYVGTYELACYLIATSDGLILINTGAPESVPMIRAHVETLGFKFSDIKILLTTHAHIDHVGGMAEIKKITGAKMMINAKDAPVLEDGGKSDYVLGAQYQFPPVKADRLLYDKDTITLGDTQLTLLHHPGHTKGANSFLFMQGQYRVLIANMPSILDETRLSGMPTYPDVAKDYGYTIAAMKKLQFDIWLSAHAVQFGLHEKHKPGDKYNPEAFVDRKGYDAAMEDLERAYIKKLGVKE